jgi:hypothetical protein
MGGSPEWGFGYLKKRKAKRENGGPAACGLVKDGIHPIQTRTQLPVSGCEVDGGGIKKWAKRL